MLIKKKKKKKKKNSSRHTGERKRKDLILVQTRMLAVTMKRNISANNRKNSSSHVGNKTDGGCGERKIALVKLKR